ncbi:organic solvent tolerance protein OstA [Phenylobacterium sp. J426]|uniref:LptA/OstA family protein n=1 Tax=Phenylobacterium sp. J426 TaxID=2898439 RepID=UPI0021516790|nr:LptA/OstA family protein [Phenylobacterium sp. J426]MCR5873740.1 organic solvent tolerance protein OstA [Phenylobacterium sp. J426]
MTLLGVSGALLTAAPAAAQLSRSSDGPIDVTADELEVQQNECVSVWRGNAEALQGDTRLRANVMRMYMTKSASRPGGAAGGCGELRRLEADGGVYYVTAQQRVRGDRGVYDAQSETITLTGDVVAVQGQNVLRGTRMVFNTKTGEGKMEGNARGANQTGRPRGVFYPSKKSNP